MALLIAVSDRGLGDTRAHAMAIGNANVDPTTVTEDLSGVRAAVRDAIKAVREVPDESLQILPLIPFVPRRAMKLLADVFIGAADLPVTCSNVGELPPEIARIDGTRPLTFVSGPSATVDIELVRITGVHGPRTLDVVVYEPGAAEPRR
ncbi:Lactate utilization protein C [Mycobacterium talmoniae]|uniref:Lactate utilization protein C n=1 Tax=Mycobacterium talmoniae TaxID=1858794 RepID=A0A2S8BR89_9MYCO|nr:Lactate utilization protein C [Mycobacterium talmoniae]